MKTETETLIYYHSLLDKIREHRKNARLKPLTNQQTYESQEIEILLYKIDALANILQIDKRIELDKIFNN